ncbi:MAG: tetratricopeptide repeat protein [Armatimonadota bacterium]
MRLWRYNYSILLGGNWWIIVLPVAASQIVTLWMMALSADFDQRAATRIAELMTPVLGAFLVAHCLAPEYRSGVGAVLACKPVSLHRVVTMRVLLALLVAVALTTVTLFVCSVGLKPIDVWQPLVASLPGLLFLSLLSLTFATLFRNALGGFGVAAGLWALDFTVGYAIHPYLSLQGLYARMDGDPLAVMWTQGKWALGIAAVVLLFLHGRLIHRVCRPPERRDVTRIAVATGAVLLAYCASGAAATLGYAYTHRAHLDTPDVDWLRRQMKVYGPVPVASFFGPALTTYVAEPTASENSSSAEVRVQQLEQGLQRYAGSLWADGMAFAVGAEREKTDPVRAVPDYYRVADRFPKSPFAPRALFRIIRMEAPEVGSEERLKAARRLIESYPQSDDAERGAEAIAEMYPQLVNDAEMLEVSQVAVKTAPEHRKARWLIRIADLQRKAGDLGAARSSAQAAVDAVAAIEARMESSADAALELRPHLSRVHGDREEALRILKSIGEG